MDFFIEKSLDFIEKEMSIYQRILIIEVRETDLAFRKIILEQHKP